MSDSEDAFLMGASGDEKPYDVSARHSDEEDTQKLSRQKHASRVWKLYLFFLHAAVLMLLAGLGMMAHLKRDVQVRNWPSWCTSKDSNDSSSLN
jgi:hypothetical protein